ncbi:MAG: sigma 54-interacting transcriptional regulator, partial [Desulfovibrionaceae bacterium]
MTRRPLDALLTRLNTESNLLRLLNALPLGVAILGPDGRVGAVNRAWETMTGTGLAEVRGLGCLHATRCDFCMRGCPVPGGQARFAPIARDGDILTRDRRRLPVRFTLAPLGGGEGAPAAYIETIQALDLADPARAAVAGLGFSGLIGASSQMDKLFRMVPSVAQTDSSVLITGETGTGKDTLAEAIHKASDRARGPFVKVNCGALPDTLLESELFGHAKGAFTGAERAKPGRFQLAHGGTHFLTEIG